MLLQFQELKLQALSSFNTGFKTVNLHRPTTAPAHAANAPLRPPPTCSAPNTTPAPTTPTGPTPSQGLTPVHCSAQCKRFLWDRGCIWGLFRGCVAGARGY